MQNTNAWYCKTGTQPGKTVKHTTKNNMLLVTHTHTHTHTPAHTKQELTINYAAVKKNLSDHSHNQREQQSPEQKTMSFYGNKI